LASRKIKKFWCKRSGITGSGKKPATKTLEKKKKKIPKRARTKIPKKKGKKNSKKKKALGVG